MRVLFWSDSFLPNIGGVEVLAAKFVTAMKERGYDYLVVTSQVDRNSPSEATYEGIPIHRFPFWHSLVDLDKLADVKQRVSRLKRTFRPDVVHKNAVGRDDFFTLTTGNAYAAPSLVTLHGGWVPEANALVQRVLVSADWVVGCSKAILDKGRELAPEIIPRSSVIYNAVNAPSIVPQQLPAGIQRILSVGRLSHEKGFDLALTAFASLSKRFPHARFILAGDGELRQELEQQAANLNLVDKVEFLGSVSPDKIPALINTATLVIVPSRQEAFGLVALEAAMMARPVVATRLGGIPEVVVDGQTGLLYERENTEALANAVAFLLEHPQAATQMGEAARRRAQNIFSWEQHIGAYEVLYQRLVNDWCRTRTNAR
jgi:glycogen(starch) synthase